MTACVKKDEINKRKERMEEKMKEDGVGEERKAGRKKDEAAQQW